ncbi:hypothetical protein Tco_1234737 [Tanacetum coccineum]
MSIGTLLAPLQTFLHRHCSRSEVTFIPSATLEALRVPLRVWAGSAHVMGMSGPRHPTVTSIGIPGALYGYYRLYELEAPESCVTDEVRTEGYNPDHILLLSGQCAKLHNIPEGVLVRTGLSNAWRNRMCDPVLRRRDTTGTPLPAPTQEEIIASQTDAKVVAKTRATAKRKASNKPHESSDATKKIKLTRKYLEKSLEKTEENNSTEVLNVIPLHSYDHRTEQKVDAPPIIILNVSILTIPSIGDDAQLQGTEGNRTDGGDDLNQVFKDASESDRFHEEEKEEDNGEGCNENVGFSLEGSDYFPTDGANVQAKFRKYSLATITSGIRASPAEV